MKLLFQNDPNFSVEGLPRNIVSMLHQRGFGSSHLLLGTRLFIEDFNSPTARLSAYSISRLFENAQHLWATPDFAFELGRQLGNSDLPLNQLFPLTHFVSHPIKEKTFVSFHAAFADQLSTAWIEMTSAAISARLGCENASTYYFAVDHHDHSEQYDVFINGVCHFDCNINGVLLEDPATLETPRQFTPALVSQVRQHIFAAQGAVPLETVSQHLGMPMGSFKRALYAHGLTFQKAIDDVRRTEAIVDMLLNGTPIETVQHRLGYATGRSFRRSFLRWTGITPVQFLNQRTQQILESR